MCSSDLRHEHHRVVGDDAKVVEASSGTKNGFFFNTLYDPETMIRVNDLVADFKCHESPCLERAMEGRSSASSSFSIAHLGGIRQREMAKNKAFLAVLVVLRAQAPGEGRLR